MKLEYETDIYKKVKKGNIITTKGRIIFNECLPEGYVKKYGFVNHYINKEKLKEILTNIYTDFRDDFFETISKLQKLSNFYMTVFNKSILFDELILPDEFEKEKMELKKIDDFDLFYKKSKELYNKVKEYYKKNNKQIYHLIESGASKGKLEPLIISKGVVSGPDYKPFITKSSISDGFNTEELFNSGFSARNGLADRVINTAHTGYLARKLVYSSASLFFDEKVKDCGTKRTFNIVFSDDMKKKLFGRYFVDDRNNLKVIDKDTIKLFSDGDKIRLRSPIYCENKKGICKVCLGEIYKKLDSKNIGVISAQILGERGTQSIMKTFHTGGALNLKNIDILKYILRNNLNITKKELSKYVKQEDNKLISLVDLVVNIKKDIIEFDNKKIIFKDYTEFKIVTENKFSFDIHFNVGSNIEYDNLNKDEEYYYIFVPKNNKIITADFYVSNVDFEYMKKVFEQSIKSKDEYELFYKIYDIYNELGNIDNIHIENIISEMCRDSDYENQPYRFSKDIDKKPLIISIKEVPYVSSPELGLFFENPEKAIENSLIFEKYSKRDSSIERLLRY